MSKHSRLASIDRSSSIPRRLRFESLSKARIVGPSAVWLLKCFALLLLLSLAISTSLCLKVSCMFGTREHCASTRYQSLVIPCPQAPSAKSRVLSLIPHALTKAVVGLRFMIQDLPTPLPSSPVYFTCGY